MHTGVIIAIILTTIIVIFWLGFYIFIDKCFCSRSCHGSTEEGYSYDEDDAELAVNRAENPITMADVSPNHTMINVPNIVITSDDVTDVTDDTISQVESGGESVV